ncbi:helix-turn-helix domain-containing protein [Anaerotignum sp.]|uniref:helix-turn-helix domain-containing protein n=1 Tax=Anaerotignum sp. TaxID=2039241 RepID=UPI0028A0AD6F|nr:helix-turn-helix transcriptional regulator [Anaerotignum sp.]
MNISEKIQLYRKANKLTQKQLSELSGVSEISVRKYEAGHRFPKPEQLKKIASVLEIGGNQLLEIELDAVKVETVGDAMALFYLLKEKLGMDFAYDVTSEDSIDPTTIYIHFKNDKINHCLERIATEEAMAEQLKQSLGGLNNETAKTQLLTDKFLLDLTKEEMCKNENLL